MLATWIFNSSGKTDCLLPLSRAQNHTPTTSRALSLPKRSPHRLLRAQALPGSCFGNAASCRLLLQLPPALPQGWHADSTTEIKTAPRREGGKKIKIKRSARRASAFCYMHPLRQRIPCSAPSCTARTAARRSRWDYRVLGNMHEQ